MEAIEQKVEQFVSLWHELSKYNIDITFEKDNITHDISEFVEICWDHDNETSCYTPVDCDE